MTDADFEGSFIDMTGFVNSNLTRANFRNTKIRFTYFRGAILDKTDFRDADMISAGFPECNRGGADLTGAKLGTVFWSFDEIDFASLVEAILPDIMKLDIPETTKMRIKAQASAYISQTKSERKTGYVDTKRSFGKILDEIYSPKSIEDSSQYGRGNLYSEKMSYEPPFSDNKKLNIYKGKKK